MPFPSVLPAAQQLLATLATRRQALTSLRGLAQLVYADSQDKGKAKQAVAVAAPNHFRLELFSLLGIVSLFTGDGHTLAAYFPKDKVIYRGAATPLNIARFLRVTLADHQIASLLLGLPILPLEGTTGTVRVDTDKGWYRLDLPLPGGGVQVLWFDPQTTLLRRWELLDGNGTTVAYMSLADYREVSGQQFPFEIVLSDIQGQQQASILYEKVELNPSLPPSLFTLAPLSGVQEIDIDTVATVP
ncbi:MAG: DUF4292 domain-containing protein [Candidatus Binatia bacterium]